MKSRREFIKYSMALSAYSLIPKAWGAVHRTNAPLDCIILGGGMAGITAANYLRRGFGLRKGRTPNILVLEGADRLGGRVYSVNDFIPGCPIELGAEYIHRHVDSVPLWMDIKKYSPQFIRVEKMDKGQVFHPMFNGQLKPMMDAIKELPPDTGRQIMSLIDTMSKYSGPDMSAKDWIAAQNFEPMIAVFAEQMLLGHYPASADEFSIAGFGADKTGVQISEPFDYSTVAGNLSIIEGQARGLNIRLGEPVREINYGPEGVEVRTDKGVYKARTGICSFSAGMLKSGEVAFSPSLPSQKLDALSALESGFQSKVVMSFKRKFWPSDMSLLQRFGPRRAGRTYFHVFDGQPNRPPVLTALISGDDAKRLAAYDDLHLVRDICADLQDMFPHEGDIFGLMAQDSQGRIMYRRKQWKDDPFAKGGISYLKVSDKIDVRIARQTLADASQTPSLFWAGEATAINTQPGSMHGAHYSGISAAYQVEQFLATGKILAAAAAKPILKAWFETKKTV